MSEELEWRVAQQRGGGTVCSEEPGGAWRRIRLASPQFCDVQSIFNLKKTGPSIQILKKKALYLFYSSHYD